MARNDCFVAGYLHTYSVISIILPTAYRPDVLKECLSSIERTAANLQNVEVLAGIEPDDEETRHILQRCLFAKTQRRHLDHLAEYQNWLATYASGEYFWLLNDDCAILTPNWDDTIHELQPQYGHTIPSGIDKEPACDYSEFPILGRKSVEALGWLAPPYCPAWGADTILFNLYNACGLVQKTGIELRHTLVNDRTHKRIGEIFEKQDYTPRKKDIECLNMLWKQST
jgi:hypothetical protein